MLAKKQNFKWEKYQLLQKQETKFNNRLFNNFFSFLTRKKLEISPMWWQIIVNLTTHGITQNTHTGYIFEWVSRDLLQLRQDHSECRWHLPLNLKIQTEYKQGHQHLPPLPVDTLAPVTMSFSWQWTASIQIINLNKPYVLRLLLTGILSQP